MVTQNLWWQFHYIFSTKHPLFIYWSYPLNPTSTICLFLCTCRKLWQTIVIEKTLTILIYAALEIPFILWHIPAGSSIDRSKLHDSWDWSNHLMRSDWIFIYQIMRKWALRVTLTRCFEVWQCCSIHVDSFYNMSYEVRFRMS